jgi:hypothetical protein
VTSPMRTTPQTDAWTLEAIRLSRRYQIEIVEACGLCPWAARARAEGAVRERVLLEPEAALHEASLEAIEELAHDERVEVGLLVYPRLPLGRMEFEHFAARVRNADAGRRPLGEAPFMCAAFHPDAEPDTEDPERLIPFLRRTPDPTIQLVRSSVLERVRAGTPQGTQFVDVRNLDVNVEYAVPLRERIARTNFATAERMGVAELKRRMDAIVGDRDRTYQRLARESLESVPAPTG